MCFYKVYSWKNIVFLPYLIFSGPVTLSVSNPKFMKNACVSNLYILNCILIVTQLFC